MMGAQVIDFFALARQAQQRGNNVDRELSAELARDRSAARLARIESIEMPDTVRAAIVSDSLIDTRALRAVRTFLTHSVPWMMLGGGPGSGKSFACWAAVAELGGVFVGAADLIRIWSARRSAEAEARRNRCFTARLLCIDDVGAEFADERAVMSTLLVELLNKRASASRKTIVTLNGGKEWFRTLYCDERLHSRIAQHARWVVDTTSPDLRRTLRSEGRK